MTHEEIEMRMEVIDPNRPQFEQYQPSGRCLELEDGKLDRSLIKRRNLTPHSFETSVYANNYDYERFMRQESVFTSEPTEMNDALVEKLKGHLTEPRFITIPETYRSGLPGEATSIDRWGFWFELEPYLSGYRAWDSPSNPTNAGETPSIAPSFIQNAHARAQILSILRNGINGNTNHRTRNLTGPEARILETHLNPTFEVQTHRYIAADGHKYVATTIQQEIPSQKEQLSCRTMPWILHYIAYRTDRADEMLRLILTEVPNAYGIRTKGLPAAKPLTYFVQGYDLGVADVDFLQRVVEYQDRLQGEADVKEQQRRTESTRLRKNQQIRKDAREAEEDARKRAAEAAADAEAAATFGSNSSQNERETPSTATTSRSVDLATQNRERQSQSTEIEGRATSVTPTTLTAESSGEPPAKKRKTRTAREPKPKPLDWEGVDELKRLIWERKNAGGN